MRSQASRPSSISELRIEHVAIERLKLDSRNPRIHSERQIKQIARSIQAFGFNVPVLADRDNKILAVTAVFMRHAACACGRSPYSAWNT
jgi:hypothetical protein